MNKDTAQLDKIYNAVQRMVANNESPDYINTFLQQQGESPETIKGINQYGLDTYAKIRQASLQAKAETETIPARAERIGKIAGAGLIGGAKGVGTGLEKVLQGYTLGGYGWLSDKAGLGYSKRQEEQQKEAEEVGLGKLNKIAGLAAELGGAIRSPVFKVLPNPMEAETNLGMILRGAGQGALASGLQSAFSKDSLADVPRDATTGAVIGGTVPIAIKGLGRLLTLGAGATTGKGEQAIKNAYSAGQRGSTAFKEGAKTNAEDIIQRAQQGREELQRAASRAINQGKNAIGKTQVDKEGLFDALRKFYNDRFVYQGKDLASKGERKVLNEADKIISKLSKGKVDINTLDVIKRQIYKIVPEASNDRAALATRDSLYGIISDYLNQASPKYAEIMKPYETAMSELKLIANETGVKEGASKITSVINKLVRTSKTPDTANLIQKLGGQELADTLAGYDLRSYLPETTIGRALATGLGGYAVGTGGASTLLGLPLMSPKLVGDIAYGLGQVSNVAPSASSTANILNYLRLRKDDKWQENQ